MIEAGIDPQRLLPGTSQTNVPDTVTLMRHAVDAGVKATVVLPPFYYKGISDEGLFRFYAEAIEGVGSNDLRVVLYHIPPIAQIGLSLELVGRLLEAFPGIVVGIKDSSGKLESMQEFASSFANFSVLAGADPFMLPLLRSGGAGCITSSSNLIGKHLRVVFDHWHDASEAARVEHAQERINAWRNLSNAYVQLPTIKAMLARRRNHAGWTRLRSPLVELTPAEIENVWAQMAEQEAQENDWVCLVHGPIDYTAAARAAGDRCWRCVPPGPVGSPPTNEYSWSPWRPPWALSSASACPAPSRRLSICRPSPICRRLKPCSPPPALFDRIWSLVWVVVR